ncbi:MAG TPA: dihydrodipicolinate synthase family protein, partial [Actinomycetota bacterium]
MAGRFGSVITAMATPFRDDYVLDLDGVQSLATWLLENGSDAVFVAGSTGESPTLTHKEKADLLRSTVQAAKGKGKVICGTGTYDTAESIELTKMAEKGGADAVVLVTPYYNRP